MNTIVVNFEEKFIPHQNRIIIYFIIYCTEACNNKRTNMAKNLQKFENFNESRIHTHTNFDLKYFEKN